MSKQKIKTFEKFPNIRKFPNIVANHRQKPSEAYIKKQEAKGHKFSYNSRTKRWVEFGTSHGKKEGKKSKKKRKSKKS